MRVLIFDVSSRLGTVGGAQRVAGTLLRELRKRGIDTYYFGYRTEYVGDDGNAFFLGRPVGKAERRPAIKGGMHGLVDSVPVRIAYYTFYSVTGIKTPGADEWLRMIRPDIVIASSIQDFVVLRRLKGSLRGAKIIYIDHANASGRYGGPLDYNALGLTFGTGSYAGLEGAQRRFFGFFDGVVVLNSEQLASVTRFNKNAIVIHSTPLLRPGKPSAGELAEFKERNGLRDRRVVLYLGRLAETQKNVGTLIRAFESIGDDRMRLIIAGDGRSIGLYVGMAAGDGRISVVGRVPEEQLGLYYAAADLYVLPSFWESFNATFMEAALFGTPLLLSTGSINDDMRKVFGDRMYTFDPHSAEDLAAKIRLFFEDGSLRKRLKELSADIAREYNMDNEMDAYAEALKRMQSSGALQ